MKRWMLALGLLVLLLVFAKSVVAEEEVDLNKLRRLAKKLEAPVLPSAENAEKQTLHEFETLTPKEAFELRKIHRKIYWPRYSRKMNKKRVFTVMEEIDKILFRTIEEKFGFEATFYGLSDDQISWLMDEVANLEEVKQLFVELEKALNRDKGCKRCSQDKSQVRINSSCEYIPSWPRRVPFREGTRWGYIGYRCDRVVNDAPNEWPCDFRIYIDSRDYKEVDGGTKAMRCALRRFGELGASSSLDRFIIGYRLMNRLYIVIIFWLSLIFVMFFVNPLYGIATGWFGLTLLGLNYFQKKNYSFVKKILFLRLLLILLFVSILVWTVYIDYRFFPLSYKERIGFMGEVLGAFKDMVIYYTLVPLLFVLNLVNLIYTSKQKYEYTILVGRIEFIIIVIFVMIGLVYTFA